jgi:hypothetical protein
MSPQPKEDSMFTLVFVVFCILPSALSRLDSRAGRKRAGAPRPSPVQRPGGAAPQAEMLTYPVRVQDRWAALDDRQQPGELPIVACRPQRPHVVRVRACRLYSLDCVRRSQTLVVPLHGIAHSEAGAHATHAQTTRMNITVIMSDHIRIVGRLSTAVTPVSMWALRMNAAALFRI